MKIRVLFGCFVLAGAPGLAQRLTVSLNGVWDIEDSIHEDDQPRSFTHRVQVPGLVHSSNPAFADVDRFDGREHIVNLVRESVLPRSALVDTAGVPRQQRNYFWYRWTFTVPAHKPVAILKINKAQFGTAVWVNGAKIGEHLPCFTAAYFNIGAHLRLSGANELLVRVGAHPGVLPTSVSGGMDFEKLRWTPGIYDDVSLLLSDNPVIESIQVAPYLSPATGITIQTKLHNYGPATSIALQQRVHGWKETTIVARHGERVALAAGEEKTLIERVPIPHARLWSPDEPYLYVLETSTGGDNSTTRFGIREFRFDTATRRAYLNGKPIFLRGSNITLHRLFEDPLAGRLPWDDDWLRKALVTIPKRMHWNHFRFCIGPVPDHWLDIADENGLLIQNEYFIWTGGTWFGKDYEKHLDQQELIGEYKEWMADNWNHASVVTWDANNESTYPDFTTEIIPAVRGLDLSRRPWENSYNPPAGPDDPMEVHPYFFITLHGPVGSGQRPFRMTDLQTRNDGPALFSAPTGHAEIVNEYGWLWLNRDGSPTKLTHDVYAKLLGEHDTAAERLRWNAYLVAGLTEFWRAYRHYAGVDHFVYLTSCDPQGYTCDNFRDIRTLELQPGFEEYVGNAFQPLGLYVNFWEPTLRESSHQTFTVMMVNDFDEAAAGRLTVALQNTQGQTLAQREQPFVVAALGQTTMLVPFDVPAESGECTLKVTAAPASGRQREPTVSRRWTRLVPAQGTR